MSGRDQQEIYRPGDVSGTLFLGITGALIWIGLMVLVWIVFT